MAQRTPSSLLLFAFAATVTMSTAACAKSEEGVEDGHADLSATAPAAPNLTAHGPAVAACKTAHDAAVKTNPAAAEVSMLACLKAADDAALTPDFAGITQRLRELSAQVCGFLAGKPLQGTTNAGPKVDENLCLARFEGVVALAIDAAGHADAGSDAHALAPDCFKGDASGAGTCAASQAQDKTEELIRKAFTDEDSLQVVGGGIEVEQINLEGFGLCGALISVSTAESAAKSKSLDACIADAGAAVFRLSSDFFAK